MRFYERLGAAIRRHARLVLLVCVCACALALAVFLHGSTLALAACNAHGSLGARTECAYRLVEKELGTEGTGEAMKLWAAARAIVKGFDTEGCHSASHRVGDIAYYHFYVADADSVKFTYPFESTMCDYGFYHGFYEHLFQDRPDPAFVLDTCGALPMGPESYKAVIRMTCFHGSGHGFVLAMADELPQREWGDIRAFADRPLAQCDELKGVTALEHGRCVYGIFAMTAQFQMLDEFGFSFATSTADRYDLCAPFSAEVRDKCVRVTAIVAVSEFGVPDTLEACAALPAQSAFRACTEGVIMGLFIDAASPQEFRQGREVCASEIVATRDGAAACYHQMSVAIHAYFPPGDTARLCAALPERYRDSCLIGVPAHQP